MDPVERILMDYRNAGEDQRLDLFLASRDLREMFREIEREESSAGSLRESAWLSGASSPGQPAPQGNRQAHRTRGSIRAILSDAKHFRGKLPLTAKSRNDCIVFRRRS